MWPCTISHDPGHRPPAARRSDQATRSRGTRPPARTYRSTSETPIVVMAATARRRQASSMPARCDFSGWNCAPITLSMAHEGRKGPRRSRRSPRTSPASGTRGRVIAVHVIEERGLAPEELAEHRVRAARARSARPAPSRRAAPAGWCGTSTPRPGSRPSPVGVGCLFALREEELQPETDAQHRSPRARDVAGSRRPSPVRRRFSRRLTEIARRPAPRPRLGRRTAPGSAVSVASWPAGPASARTTLARLFTP